MTRTTTIDVHVDEPIATINKNVYGHFAEHLGTLVYEGIWVGHDSAIPNDNGLRRDVVAALKRIKPPVLRWPGGCFADDYHWRDGIGPPGDRPTRVNRWWNALEPNTFGTHEFLELCNQLGTEPYICGNVGSGTVREMAEWVEYLNEDRDTTLARLRAENGHPAPFNVRFFGVGNENWGCGGHMTPAQYANEFRKHATYLQGRPGSPPMHLIACGANAFDYGWTGGFFNHVSGKACKCGSVLSMVGGFAFHYYCGTAGTATTYNEQEWYGLLLKALAIDELITEHRAIMDTYDPARKVDLACDEWGTWHKPMEGTEPAWLKQHNTMRDAVIAALTLDIFNNRSDIIKMANIAQVVNVLQAMILTDGPKMCCTPTYHVYELYAPHQDAAALSTTVSTDEIGDYFIPRVAGSCSMKDGKVTLSLVNTHVSEPAPVEIKFSGTGGKDMHLDTWRLLASGDIHDGNTPEKPDLVRPVDKQAKGATSFELPPASISTFHGTPR